MRILTLSTIALATALSAGVAAANPGIEQLAASAGVSAADFTPDQLIRLVDAQRENDRRTIDFIMGQSKGTVSRSTMGESTSVGAAQLALAAGVEPGRFTNAELIRLTRAQRDNETDEVAFILSGKNRVEASAGVSAGKAQLAASIGVNPQDYTLTELTRLTSTSSDNN